MNAPTPQHDTTAFLDEFRAAQLSHLLVAAVTDFDVGAALDTGPRSFADLCERLELAERPAIVLLTALRSMQLLEVTGDGRLALTDYGREKLSPQSPFHLRGYIGLGMFSGDVQHTIACLRDDHPPGAVSFVFHEDGHSSALDDPMTADVLTRAMADRARSIAPFLADAVDLAGARRLVDVGGGHGLYSYALLQKYPTLEALIVDRAPALRVAREYAASFGLTDRVRFTKADVHTVELDQPADAVLLANLLHDYNVEDAESLIHHFSAKLSPGGQMLVVDSLLNSVPPDAPPVSDGPRAVAAYSGLLFSLCEGRCYRLDEVQTWLESAGLQVDERIVPLPAHGSIVCARKA